MIRIITTLFVLFFSLVYTTLFAQNSSKAPCASEKYRQFDFWVGNWNVYNAKGALIGTNKILKLSNACAIQENWESKTSPSKGTSYNFYNKTDDAWHQVWVDNSGFSLNLSGTYAKGKMVLKSPIVKGKKGDYYNQVTWSKNTDGSVTQVWELLDTNGKIVQEVFRGIYKKALK